MGKQFENVDCSRGAPMGRSEWRADEPIAPRSVSVFRVRLDSGGYDDGGAYWGAGRPLYCARDDAGAFRVFVRAMDRAEAIEKLRIAPHLLKRPAAHRLYWWTESSGRIEFQMRAADVRACAHSGDCAADVATTIAKPYLSAQLARIEPEILRAALREYGAWNLTEMSDHAANLSRIVWLAANDIQDSDEWKG